MQEYLYGDPNHEVPAASKYENLGDHVDHGADAALRERVQGEA